MMHRALPLAACLAALPAAQAVEPVPMHNTPSGHYAVNVSIRGDGPWPFVVDTGASHTAIAQPLAEHFGFVSSFERTDDVQALTNRFRAERFVVEDVLFGPAAIERLDAVVVPIAPDDDLAAYGLLGADAFGEGLVEIDFAGGLLHLDAAPPEHADARIDPATGLIFATARISGVRRRVDVLIDSGAVRTLVNPALAASLYEAGAVIALNVGGVTDTFVRTEAVRLDRVRLGALCERQNIALKADLDIFRALGWEDRPAMVVGLDILDTSRIVIDRRTGAVEISPGPEGAGCPTGRIQRGDPS